MRNKLLAVFVVLILSSPGLFALFHPGFFATDDGSWMIVRFSAFYDALKHGQFPVRYLTRLNFGYGYPVADFLYPLFLYLGVPIKIIGFSFINTIKIIFGVSLVLSAIFSFFWLKKRFSYLAAITGAVAYALFPYHLWDIYKRGSVGEVLALAIVPFILWQIERGSIALVAIGIGLLITAHNVMALFFLPIAILYAYLLKKFSLKHIIITTILGLGLSAFFWFPALMDKQYTVFDSIKVSSITSYFLQIKDYILFGFISMIAVVQSVFYIKNKDKSFLFFFILGVLSILFTFSITKMIWEIVPGTNLIQFPFRLLSITTLSVSFLVAYNIEQINKSKKLFLTGVYILIIFLSTWNVLLPRYFENYPDTYYSTNVDSTTVKNEYLPKWVKDEPTTLPTEKVQIISGVATISALQANPNKVTFTVSSNTPATIRINIIYFPGWKVYVDDKMYPFSYDNPMGVIDFVTKSGTQTVRVQFSETIARLISDIVSALFVVAVICMIILERKKFKL